MTVNPSLLSQYAKAVCGAVVAAAGAAATAAADGHISIAEGCLIAVAFFGTLGGVSAVKNTLTAKQLLAQPGYAPAAAHVPMPLDFPDAIRQEQDLQHPATPIPSNRKALGRRPAKNAPALKFADHLAAVPQHPITDLAPFLSWPMDHNDTVGCCVVAGLDHFREAVYMSLGVNYTPWTDAELLKLYQTQNPSFKSWSQGGGPADQGMDIQTLLEYLVKQGVILGFAKVDHTNVDEMRAAIYLGLGVITGEVLTSKNMTEPVWDYHARDPQEGGHCLAPGTRILTDDLRYVPIENVLVGEGLIGFDESPDSGDGQGRQYRRAVVEERRELDLPCYDLTFSDGTKVRCSADHQWLNQDWVRTDRMRIGPTGTRTSEVRKLLPVWEVDDSRGAGYLAAAFDGEGHLGTSKGNVHKLGFAQRDNEMWEQTTRELKERDFVFSERETALGGYPGSGFVRQLSMGHRSQVLRFLGSLRPHRLLAKFSADRMGAIDAKRVRLVSKEYVGIQRVIALKTTTGTFIAEGLASHNCTVSVGYNPTEDQVSWGALYSMTDAFLAKNVEEAWFVITQAHVDHPAFRAGFDLASFAAAYQAMTGATFPVPVTPDPVPTPDPTPDPTPVPAPVPVPPGPVGTITLTPPADVLAKVTARAAKKGESVEAYVEHALEQYIR